MKRNRGFTLSEVLITLVIIGIIAGLTVPVLIQHHKRVETAAKLKKAYSAMAQAIRLAETETGTPSPQWRNDRNTHDSSSIWFKYIAKYLPTTEVEYEVDDESTGILYTFNDGTAISYFGSGYGCGSWASGFEVDINGLKGPNERGRDRFCFCLHTENHINNDYHNLAKPFEPAQSDSYFMNGKTATREELLDDCKKYSYYCTALIMNDGWEIKSDYPYRL